MSHEPECATYHPSGDGFDLCICDRIRAAYQRGHNAGVLANNPNESYAYGFNVGLAEGKRIGYTAGYNDHARSRAYAEQVYGPYTQHGKGENP